MRPTSRSVSYLTLGTYTYELMYRPSQMGRNLSVSSRKKRGQVTTHSSLDTYLIAFVVSHYALICSHALDSVGLIGYSWWKLRGTSKKIGLKPLSSHFRTNGEAPVFFQKGRHLHTLPEILSSISKSYYPNVPASYFNVKFR